MSINKKRIITNWLLNRKIHLCFCRHLHTFKTSKPEDSFTELQCCQKQQLDKLVIGSANEALAEPVTLVESANEALAELVTPVGSSNEALVEPVTLAGSANEALVEPVTLVGSANEALAEPVTLVGSANEALAEGGLSILAFMLLYVHGGGITY